MENFNNAFGRLWNALPYDGQGFLPPPDAALADVRRAAAAKFWKRTPWWSRPILLPLSRLAWVLAAVRRVRRFTRIMELPRQVSRRLMLDCIRSGARPNEALIWRQFFRPEEAHPLPGRATGVLLSRLGSATEHALLADKLRTAELLSGAGLPAPPTIETILRGQCVDPSGLVWSQPGQLFVKPRHGSASRGAMVVEVLAPGSYRINGGSPLRTDFLRYRLVAPPTDDLLVQRRLIATPELADLAVSSAAPVLRLTTARNPGAAPFLHSALLSVDVPNEQPRNFIRGQIRAPIDLASGTLSLGVWFLHPGERYPRVPWNQAPLAGRVVPDLKKAMAMVMKAMTLVPELPLVNWDVILTAEGPVILEGNTGGNWILTNLSAILGMQTVSLAPLLRRWASVKVQG